MTQPKISIIIPSFNQGKYLEKTILSILDQQYPNLELIIVDGNSTDNSIEIIKKYESHFKHAIIEPDQGQSDALNKGIAVATGEIINWINSDDYLEKNALNIIANAFEDINVNIVSGVSILYTEGNKIVRYTSKGDKGFPNMIAKGHIMQPSTFFRKNIFTSLGSINEELHFMMDHYHILKYWIKYGTKGIKNIDNIIAHVTFHPEAKSYKHHIKFVEDRDWIYQSLFNHHHVKYIPLGKILKSHSLEFSGKSEAFINNYKKINYYLLRHYLFNVNQFGKRISLNFGILIKILVDFSDLFISEIISFKK